MANKKTPTKAELLQRIASLERIARQKRGPGRPRLAPANMIPTGKFTLEITEPNGRHIRRFKNLSKSEFEKYRRDFYKAIVIGLKQKITMNKIVEYRRAE